MSRFHLALAAILAPVAFAVPQAGYGAYGVHGHRGHAHAPRSSGVSTGGPNPSGSGLSPFGSASAPYGFDNSTDVSGPTGTGTGVGSPRTVTVVPVPVSTTGGNSGNVQGGSGSENSPTGLSSAGGQCGPATVTITSANTVTVTVPASSPQKSSPISTSAIPSAPYPSGNVTSVIGPTGTVGTRSSIPTAPGLPIFSGLPSSNIASPVGSSTAANGALSASAPAPVQSYSAPAPVTPSGYADASYTPNTSFLSSAEATKASSASAAPVTPSSYRDASYTPNTSFLSSAEAIKASSASAQSYSASTPSSTPTHTSSPSTSGGNVVARGLVYNTASLTPLFEGSSIGWAYNWDSTPRGTIPSSMNFVPMLWNTSSLHLPLWPESVNTAISNGATHILGFNEPDLPYQANMSPGEAAAAWKPHMEQFGGKVKIGSPAVCNGDGTTGLNWLKSFMSACPACQIDFIAIHWYGDANPQGVADLKKHIGDTKAMAGGRPIWLTEFQPKGDAASQQDFMGKILPFLDDKSNGIERYAYYQVDGILTSGGSKTPLGDAYAAAKSG